MLIMTTEETIAYFQKRKNQALTSLKFWETSKEEGIALQVINPDPPAEIIKWFNDEVALCDQRLTELQK